MKKATRILALVLCAVMCLGLFVGCGNKGKQNSDTPLVVGYSPFNSKFSPFFSETAYDQDVWTMTAIGLLNSDRQGSIIMNGIKGETKSYNGTDYTYYGPADCEIKENTDGTVDYNFKMREDLKFSDGEPITIELEYVDALEDNGQTYMAFFPTVDDETDEAAAEDFGLVILKSVMENGEELLTTLDSDQELQRVYDLFMEQLMDEDDENS